jgi:glycolate oxidase iron-sulfur subunit
MQTAFTAEQLRDPGIAEAAHILKDCVHYGFCTSVCPTWVLSRDENEAPRGRIDLIRAMLESGRRPDAKTVGHIDTCLSCNSCMTTCAAKVDYMHLVDRARVHIERSYRRPLVDRLTRMLVAGLLPRPRRFRAAVRLAAFARPLGPVLPARLRTMLAMAPRRLPPSGAATAPGVYPAEGARRMRVALLPGCVQQVLAPHINDATIRVLTRHGCEVVVAAGARCCGALTLHMGKEDRALADARATIDAWMTAQAEGGLDAVVVNASGCGTTVKDYGHWLRHDQRYAAAAAELGAKTRDATELLVELGLRMPDASKAVAVAYHDACSLQHAQHVTEPPRALLTAAGFAVRDVPERHFCCGSAGAYNLLQPGYAEALGMRKAGHIESTGAPLVAAGNLGCMTQIGRFTSRPVVHTVELLDWATGGPVPPALEGIDLPAAADAASAEPSPDIGVW